MAGTLLSLALSKLKRERLGDRYSCLHVEDVGFGLGQADLRKNGYRSDQIGSSGNSARQRIDLHGRLDLVSDLRKAIRLL